MCGIAGELSLTGRPLGDRETVRRMTDRLFHRGPDEGGLYLSPCRTVALGHRRLRVIDLERGQQPLSNEDGSVVLVFNGEIYGFSALQRELQLRGHRFRSSTDGEVIAHLYEEEGIACLDRIQGMFAFALWDRKERRLILARDRLGKKPLYYTLHEGSLLFASELQALASVPGLSREIDELAIDLFVTFGYIPAPFTIYRGVQKLSAGHYLESFSLRQARFWMPGLSRKPPEKLGFEEAKERLVERLREATRLRMVSDVPLGCFLSGGVDSSTVLSFMAELSERPVKTFAIGFPDEEFSELRHARLAASVFGADHHELVVEPQGIEILDRLVHHFGEPFADSSAVPTWYLSEMTRRSVTVALTGDGGDELFGGYGWHRTGRILESCAFVPRWMTRAGGLLPDAPRPRALRVIRKASVLLSTTPGRRHAMLRRIAPSAIKRRLYRPDFAERTAERSLDWLEARYDEIDLEDPLNRMMAADLATYMAEDLLVKVDRTSMAHSLECRSPLLDSDLVDWVLALPSSYKLSSRGGKLLLREAVRARFPPGFLDRPKQGFSIPLGRWLRDDLRPIVSERVLHGPLEELGIFDRAGLHSLVEEHFSGRASHEAVIWAALFLSTWVESARGHPVSGTRSDQGTMTTSPGTTSMLPPPGAVASE